MVGLVAVGLPYRYPIGMIIGLTIDNLMKRGVPTLGTKET
jgi:hypothetical protein